MKKPTGIAILACAVTAAAAAMQAAESEQPAWAYAIPTAADREIERPPEPDDRTPLGLPGTDLRFSPAEIRGYARDARDDQMAPADWHPGDHPPMPDIVAIGAPSREVRACAFCHYPNGKAYPGTAGLAGLPAEYIAQQLHDFRDGLRETAEPQKENVEQMINIAKGMTKEEIESAASYFASMQWTP